MRSPKNIKCTEGGVGSGCISLSILASIRKPLDWLATDISQDAVDVFEINAQQLSDHISHHQLEVKIMDRLLGITDNSHCYDLVLSNPPYIKTEVDKNKVHKGTYNFEPHLALFLPDDTYEQWFREFFEQVSVCLNEGGCFMMEGHEDHLEDLLELAEKTCSWSSCEIIKDLTRRQRFLVLRK